jgi:hypothetical protein
MRSTMQPIYWKFISSASLFLFSACCSIVYSQNIRINEVLASNQSTLADEDEDFPDWLEVYNSSTDTVQLDGILLLNVSNPDSGWAFPSLKLPPAEFLVVFASGKNRQITGEPLHTNFKIQASECTLLLIDPNGNLLDSVTTPTLPPDISFGRSPDGSDNWLYYEHPSPGGANNSTLGYSGISGTVSFSHSGGFYTNDFLLNLATDNPDAQIYYSLDGSDPHPDGLNGQVYAYKNSYPTNPGDPIGDTLYSAHRSHLYTEPLLIYNRSPEADSMTHKSSTYALTPGYFPDTPVFKGTVVKARAVKVGCIPGPITTHSFFVHPNGSARYSIPVISLSTNPGNFFDYHNGIYNAGVDFDTWRVNNPNSAVNLFRPANYLRSGALAERTIFLELFEPSLQSAPLRQAAGMRIHGGATRGFPRKSIRLYARESYESGNFEHTIFPDQPYNAYRRLILRNSGNEHNRTLFRDAAIQAIMAPLRFDVQAYRPAILFVNGEYWGIHNIRERYDQHYLNRVYGIPGDKVDLLYNNQIADHGDNLHYAAMLDYINQYGLQDSSQYAHLLTLMDVENFTDYQIANIFARNTDWPQNNIKFFRERRDSFLPDAPYGRDGRWRWMMFDTDFGFGYTGTPPIYDNNTLIHATNPDGATSWSTFLLRSLLENEEFKTYFAVRFTDLLNSLLLASRTEAIIDSMSSAIDSEVLEHFARWKNPSYSFWNAQVNIMRSFATHRPAYQREHLEEFFELETPLWIQVDVSDEIHGYVQLNTLPLKTGTAGVADQPYPWSGDYYQELPVRLEAIPYPGYAFAGWVGLDSNQLSPIIHQLFEQDSLSVKALFTPLPPAPDSILIHYWHFNDLADNPDSILFPNHTLIGQAHIQYPGTGDGFFDPVNDGSPLNLYLNQGAGGGLRVRNPSDTRRLQLALSSQGYENLRLRYAVKRTASGAQEQELYYRTHPNDDWQPTNYSLMVTPEYILHSFDLSSLPGTDNNPNLEIQIRFTGENASADSGNNRFDNISLSGSPIACPLELIHYWNFNLDDEDMEEPLSSTYSAVGSGNLSYPGTGDGYMDLVNDGSTLNVQFDGDPGRGLRLRNPSESRVMEIQLPSSCYQSLVLRYATRRTTLGAQQQHLYYRTDGNGDWIHTGNTVDVREYYVLQSFDLSHLANTDNNAELAFQLRFGGENADVLSGNNRIDNLSLWGIQAKADTTFATICRGEPFAFFELEPDSSGVYLYTEPITDGCDSIHILFLHVVSPLQDSLEFNGIQLLATPEAEAYQWFTCIQDSLELIPDEYESTLVPLESGWYAAEFTLDGCSFITPCLNVQLVHSGEAEAKLLRGIFPNPSAGQVTLEFNRPPSVNEYVVLYSLIGQELANWPLFPGLLSETLELPKTLSAGAYLLRIGNQLYQLQYIPD